MRTSHKWSVDLQEKRSQFTYKVKLKNMVFPLFYIIVLTPRTNRFNFVIEHRSTFLNSASLTRLGPCWMMSNNLGVVCMEGKDPSARKILEGGSS